MGQARTIVSRRRVLQAASAAGALGVLGAPATAFAGRDDDDALVRWDIVSVNPATGEIRSGGHASAFATDKSKITLTGSGTLRAKGDGSDDVTGGGSWTTSGGAVGAGSGTYRVTGLVSFVPAPGSLPASTGLTDRIGNQADAHAGLVFLRVRFSNGRRGILTVGCSLVGTPASVLEGITASMGFVDFWSAEQAQDNPFVDADRTLFHFRRRED